MNGSIRQAWDQLTDSISSASQSSLIELVAYLILGGLLAMYIRFLYVRTSRTPMSTDAVARVFPLLTLVTTAVIAVVKTSLALSLGLVGALSIVRFRAAIKDPEELVYLFLCIAVGLALGAEQPLIAIALVAVATLFILVFERFQRGGRDAYLTIVGDAKRYFDETEGGAMATVRELCPRHTVQRCEVEDDEGQLRVQVHGVNDAGITKLVADLRKRLPDCHIAYLNAEALY